MKGQLCVRVLNVLGGLSPQDPIKLAAVTYFLKYALTHLGCKKHHKIHLRQVSHAVLSIDWVDDDAHDANQSGEDSPSLDEVEDVVEVVEVDSDGGTLDQSGEGPTSPNEAEDVEVEVDSGGGTVHVDVQSRAAEAVGSDPVAGSSTGHAQTVDLQGAREVRTRSVNRFSSYNDPAGTAGGRVLRRSRIRPTFQQKPAGTCYNRNYQEYTTTKQ